MVSLDTLTRPRVPKSSRAVCIMLIACSTITSTTLGYDGSMMNGLNILPSFTEHFGVTTLTMSLSTSGLYIGATLGALVFPSVADRISRRGAILVSALLTLVFVIIQTASVHIAMFTFARIGLGFAEAGSAIATPTYLAETFPYKYRGWGLGLMCDFYYVGALVAAGVTYGTSEFTSTWSWRLPSLLQAFWSILCIVILVFLPESPRYLAFKDQAGQALTALAQIGSDGDESDPLVLAQLQEIVDALEFERSHGNSILSLKEIAKSKTVLRRLMLVVSCALATVIVGNQIGSYYLGTMLSNAGITNANTQLQITIILNAWCLLCALLGTYYAESLGRRLNALISSVLLTLFLFLVGVLTKLYGTSTNTAGVYGTVASIFLFMGSYSFGWTPLAYLYPPEILNYSIRSFGMGVNTFVMYGFGLVFVFSIPFALESLGWQTYMMNGAWNVLLILFIYFYWVETKGKTLEEIDAEFDGEKHSSVPNMADIESMKHDSKEIHVETHV